MNTHISCTSLEEVRRQIDRVDRQLVQLIAERGIYVAQAATLKRSATEISAPARVAQVIERVRTIAAEFGASPTVVEATWRAMIAAFIEHEQVLHAASHPPIQTG